MTSLPASFYGLQGKGNIKEKMDADIVIFDPKKIKDNADYKQPLLPNEGINYVIVNGKVAIKENKPTEPLNGKIIRA
jgi:N-acyl-D-amino-acid deacylase